MNKRYLTAIVIGGDVSEEEGRIRGFKFRNIMNTEPKIEQFMRFAAQLPGAHHVNFYYQAEHTSELGKNFAFQRRFENP